MKIKSFLKSFLDILFPPLCFNCEKKTEKEVLCLECETKINFLAPPLCRFCSRPQEKENSICSSCRKKIFPYSRLIAIAKYNWPLKNLIHHLKYRHCQFIADYLGKIMIKHLLTIGFSPPYDCCIIPVPQHRLRRKIRGYNQSLLLAERVANYFKIPLRDDIIIIKEYRNSQTKLSFKKRQSNLKGIFAINSPLKEKRVILVDDIFTTGSTIYECARTIKLSGAEDITAITLAKTFIS